MSLQGSRRFLKVHVFMGMAHELKALSTCARRATACILTDEKDRIVGMGYNGVAAQQIHCTEIPCAGAKYPSGTGLEHCEAIHAEQNALIVCEHPFKIHSCYAVTFPCMHCIKMLLNTSCKHIYYAEKYPHMAEAQKLWQNAGRDTHLA